MPYKTDHDRRPDYDLTPRRSKKQRQASSMMKQNIQRPFGSFDKKVRDNEIHFCQTHQGCESLYLACQGNAKRGYVSGSDFEVIYAA